MMISIIIPIYNVAQYVVRCLDSVSNQTYAGKIECILVDDCGPDNSLEICENYVKNYKKQIDFKIIRRKENGGLSAARNSGIEVATGDYIYFLDSDDEVPPNAIELLSVEVAKHPGIDVVMGFMEDDKRIDYYNLDCFRSHQYVTDNRWLQYNSFNNKKIIPVNGCNKLLRKKFILDNNLLFKIGIIHEDDHWMFYLVKYAQSWAFVFEPTYIRYWNEGSIVASTNREKESMNWFKIMLDHSINFYEPFYTLQLSKYMNMYFNQRIFEFHYPNSRMLHFNFIQACIKKHLWKGAFLLSIWSFLYDIRDGFRLKRWLMDYSRSLFEQESIKSLPCLN